MALHEGEVIASVRLTSIRAGAATALLLAPWPSSPTWKNLGTASDVVKISVAASDKAGWDAVVRGRRPLITVRSAFQPIPRGRISMPRPVDPARLLAAELRGVRDGAARQERSGPQAGLVWT